MRILIVNLNWIGDVLFSTFLIRCLRKRYPTAYIASLISTQVQEVLRGNPYLNELIPFEQLKEKKFPFLDPGLISLLRGRKFSHSIHLHRSLTRKFWSWLSGIEKRIGYDEKFKGLLLTQKFPSQRDRLHRAFYYFYLGQALQVEDDGGGLDFFLTEQEVVCAKALLGNEARGHFCIFHIGANWSLKRWPLKYWAQLTDLVSTQKKVRVVITGRRSDASLAEEIYQHSLNKPILLAGQTDLRQLAGLIKLSSFFVGVDSAPLHLAVALSVPSIGIYGPTSPRITGPFRPSNRAFVLRQDVGCEIPCYQETCHLNNKCMSLVLPEAVLEQIDKLF